MPNPNISSFDSTVIKFLLQINEQGEGGVAIPSAPEIGDAPAGPQSLATGDMPMPQDATTPIDDDEIDGHEHGSPEWEQRWVAWLFQIISALTFLQSALQFTHNDSFKKRF